MRVSVLAVLALGFASTATPASAEGMFDWVRGDWYLTLGGSAIAQNKFEGSKDVAFNVAPIISLGKVGPEARFSSRNDNISFALLDKGSFRAGVAGKLISGRDSDKHDETRGLDDVKFGGELGGFAEVYPTDWVRVRGEVRHGIRSHSGVVADLSADAFYDVNEKVRVSAGPRASFATGDYFDVYYGVNADEADASGLAEYKPGGGVKSVGFGGAINWKTTEKLTTSVFAEYSRLTGPAADSSLVKERGSKNQFMIGASATYRFDFRM